MATTLVLALALAAGPAAAHDTRRDVGDPGAGDPYFPNYGNGGYDVRHYDINVRFNPDNERLGGRTVIKMVPDVALSRFNLDLVLPASEVRVNGELADFRQSAHELVVTPDSELPAGTLATVVVRYAGVPEDETHNGISPWITTHDGAVALGEPEIAAWWFPSNDHPTDKATYLIDITVPTGKEAISNGELLVQLSDPPYNWTTWRWSLRSQAATYLVFAAIGDYEITSGVSSSGRKYMYAIGTHLGPRIKDAATASMEYTATATDFLEQHWGPYPFQRIGGVVPSGFDIGFALETQTRPVYDAGFFAFEENRWVVIHEMAHQWFGDSVAVNRWKNIWMNEGWATYSEWLWEGPEGGPSPGRRLLQLYNAIPAGDPFWDLRIGDPGPGSLFDGAVYDRGAMTAQALRNRVGRVDFFRIVRTWLRTREDGNGNTAQFKALAEQISGEDLDGLFHAWLFTGAKPARTADNGL